ncbi:23045_t:CDS:2, partial [Dentiscutata erythropus]
AILANKCPNCSKDIGEKKLLQEILTTHEKKALPNQTAIISYFLSNYPLPKAVHKLSFPNKKLTEADLQDACNLSSVSNIMSYEENQIDNDNETLSDISNYFTTLLINEIIDLEIEKNSEPPMEETS